MADLRQVVDLHSIANVGFPNARPVDASVDLHLDIIAQNRWASLNDLVPMSFVVFGEAKTVSARELTQEFYARIALAPVFFKGKREFAVAGKKPGLRNLLILGYGKSWARSRAGAKKRAKRKKQCDCRQVRQKEEQQLLPSH